jgi:hypothetical protein
VKRAVHFEASVARTSSDGGSDSEEDNDGDERNRKQRRSSTGAEAAAEAISSDDKIKYASVGGLFDFDDISDSEDWDDEEDDSEDETQIRTVAQLQYKRIPIVGEVVVGMRVMGHWNDVDGWFPATVVHEFAAGDVKFRIKYDADDEEGDVGDERLGQLV